LGMDLLRLGLERGATARDALDVIVHHLEAYGQGGNCAEYVSLNYHNSFLIADNTEAWVLETAGQYWVAERITSGTRSISNNLSIHGAGDLRHVDLIEDMVNQQRLKPDSELNFAQLFAADAYQKDVSPYSREGRVQQLCQIHDGTFNLETAQYILRDHESSVCMHGQSETRGSQISTLGKHHCEHRFIRAPFPCQQDYKISRFC